MNATVISLHRNQTLFFKNNLNYHFNWGLSRNCRRFIYNEEKKKCVRNGNNVHDNFTFRSGEVILGKKKKKCKREQRKHQDVNKSLTHALFSEIYKLRLKCFVKKMKLALNLHIEWSIQTLLQD